MPIKSNMLSYNCHLKRIRKQNGGREPLEIEGDGMGCGGGSKGGTAGERSIASDKPQ